MSALKLARSRRVRVPDAVGMIDCGRASRQTQGVPLLLFYEYGVPPLVWLYLL